ncbi:APA family fibronectin-binding glycoprotein [Mycobacterium sp. ZZG]
MDQPDVHFPRRKGLPTSLRRSALTGATAAALAAALTVPAVAYAQPAPPPSPAPAPAVEAPAAPPAAPPPADPNAPVPPAPAPPPPPADPNAPVPPPADPNAPVPPADPNAPAAPAPEPGRVDNAAGGFSYVVPEGWEVSDSTQLSYGQALLTKLPPAGSPPDTQPPNDTSVLLGRLDLKLFAGAETDNTKAAQRLASDMGEFFMPFPGTRINQQTVPLENNGVASSYEVKFTDTNKPNGQIWAGVVGTPVAPGTPRGQRTPERWFVVWLGTATNPIPQEQAVALANSIRRWTPPPPPPAADPNAPVPPADPNAPPPDPNAPAPRPAVGVPVPVDPNTAPGMLPPA